MPIDSKSWKILNKMGSIQNMRRKKKARKAVSKDKDKDKELILKTKSEWIKNALVKKTKYQKKYSD